MAPETTPPEHPSAAQEADADRSAFSRIRVSKNTSDRFKRFVDTHGVENDPAIMSMIETYESVTQYRYSSETGHLIAELRALDADVTALVKINLQLMEMVCRVKAAQFQVLSSGMETIAKRV